MESAGKNAAITVANMDNPVSIKNNQTNSPVSAKTHEIRGIEADATPNAKTNLMPNAVDRHLGGEYLAKRLFSAGEPIVLLTTIAAKTGINSPLCIIAASTSRGVCNNQHTK